MLIGLNSKATGFEHQKILIHNVQFFNTRSLEMHVIRCYALLCICTKKKKKKSGSWNKNYA